ncbi:hypothetical protein NC797_09720 [Aquibacillus sp. 3ASR75-11]|uniref:Uncharacterized protein n=1 Tax=Terrihalobacillus insolitus TaxID=2950438 RepID=A0A9X3WS13_9BACI|nr:hypothetical protein [Terrihalobacillus insolitus]MDC3413045.1 hypothetical protein [Terrihalobacillus insolitus]MDC3424787.1 hypothetical protein [Terrihalobacillus insolitus]
MEAYSFYSKYVWENGEWKSRLFHVEDGKFTRSIRTKSMEMRLNVDSFWLGPGKVYVDSEEPVYYQLDYQNTVKKFMYRGCTLLLCQLPVINTSNYRKDFFHYIDHLKNMPIDHMIVPIIPAPILKDEHIRFFGRQKVPFLLIETSSQEDLLNIKWEWIQQAQSFSRMPLMYKKSSFLQEEINVSELWHELCKNYNIPSLHQEIGQSPLSTQTLRLSGISPFHGEFVENGSADYNLFDLSSIQSVDESLLFRYDKAIPVVTVANGNVIKANHLVLDQQQNGKYQKVSIPQHFVYEDL